MLVRNKALNQLMLFLGHTYPRVSEPLDDARMIIVCMCVFCVCVCVCV